VLSSPRKRDNHKSSKQTTSQVTSARCQV